MSPSFVTPPGIYLLNHSIGLHPEGVRDRINQDFLSVWESDPAGAWPAWLEQIELFRAALGRLFAGEPISFCPQVNVSSALTKILHSFERNKTKDRLLLTEDAFPSLGFVFDKAKALGYRPRFIDRRTSALGIDVWDRFLTDDTAFALITHAHSNTGEQLPVAEITKLAKERGIITVVDVAQSAGVLPINLGQWNADFVLGTSVKWLCGGPGACFLWASPGVIQRAEPTDVGWFSHENPFEFDIHSFRYAEDALRFFGGTPSVIPFVIARHAIDIIAGIGVDRIRAHNLELSGALLGAIPERWLVSPRDPQHRSGTVVIDPGSDRKSVSDRLMNAGIMFDARAQGLRLSPHIYNTVADIDAVIACF